MRIARYSLSFHCPAFLGDAGKNGQWRTPPFKAQLRQWWRLAFAANHAFAVNIGVMRDVEGRLFGNASHDSGSSKSLLRIRLDQWRPGKLLQSKWEPIGTVRHPEVPVAVGADLYLGFGPIALNARRPTLKADRAIQPGERANFAIACPEEHAPLIEQALFLMDRFGTVGGRSRNGWGSYSLSPLDGAAMPDSQLPLRPWHDALALDWPHALGQDGKGALIWQTQPFADWTELMRELARIKIGLRTQFRFTTGKNAPCAEARHWLSYPVTHHSVAEWNGSARLPNSLRFKLCPAQDNPAKIVGVVFHAPCLPPAQFRPDVITIKGIWERVHAFLDSQPNLARIST